MPRMSKVLEEVEEIELPIQVPEWRRTPCSLGVRGARLSPEELAEQINTYCADRYDHQVHPTFCDLAGATGFDSFTQMMNHARRKGGDSMRHISRAFLAVGAGYEEQAQEGSRVALAILEKMPQFDTEEPASQYPERPFCERRDVNLNITGLARPEDRGRALSGSEAYLALIKNKTYEELIRIANPEQEPVEAEYEVLDFPDEPDEDNDVPL